MRQISGHTAVAGISLALRYVHSTVETADKKDMEACVNLLAAYLSTTKGVGYELGSSI
jgi:putative aminopeptidase FrvX